MRFPGVGVYRRTQRTNAPTPADEEVTSMNKLIARGAFAIAILLWNTASAQDLTILRSFPEVGLEVKVPVGALTLDGNVLYGMTFAGTGVNDRGTIFKMSKNNGGSLVIHKFNSDIDGAEPYGSLVRGGTTLYGMTSRGQFGGWGMLFRINTD